MSIRISCPQCQAVYNLADSTAGKRIKCARCTYVFQIAAATNDPSAGAAPAGFPPASASSSSVVFPPGTFPVTTLGSSAGPVFPGVASAPAPSYPTTPTAPYPSAPPAAGGFPIAVSNFTSGPRPAYSPKKKPNQLMLIAIVCSLVGLGVSLGGYALHFASVSTGGSRTKVVQDQFRKMVAVMQTGDVDGLLGLQHPKAFSSAADKAKYRAEILADYAPMKEAIRSGQLRVTCTFPRPPKFVDGKVHEFAFVPVRMKFHVGGELVNTVDFSGAAVRKRGTATFLLLRETTAPSMRKMFPDYPLSLLPAP